MSVLVPASAAPGDRPSGLQVWIDQDLCTGDGICADLCPDVFVILEDGIAYVREGHEVMNDPGGAHQPVPVPAGRADAVVQAAEFCPGECIFVEAEHPDGTAADSVG